MSGITPEELCAMAGILLSLGFSYIPGVMSMSVLHFTRHNRPNVYHL
jgi:hypothetical protein